jgi:ubiquinone/menaquinone biosynthesis C-methylase UbiE
MSDHVCPWWLAYTFDNPLRRFFHEPEKILAPHLKAGMTAVDFGCGMGYFSIAMAKIVGKSGRVIGVDLQQEMLAIMLRRAQRAGVAERITPVLCNSRETGVTMPADFALAFWMVHETPDAKIFLKQVYAILKISGRLLIAEPKMHVSPAEFNRITAAVRGIGFQEAATPAIRFSHAALFHKK